MNTMTDPPSPQSTAGKKKLPSHDLFDVQDRDGQKAFWNKVGAAFENRDQSHSVLVYQPGMKDDRKLQLRFIDREKFPLRDGADPKRSPTHELFEVVEMPEGERNNWNRVGVAFTNKDGSLSLIVDDGNRDGPKPPRETIALRFQLANLRDELELFGWRAEDTARYARQALTALPLAAVIELFRDFVAEEKSYYSHHSPLADDQLDHTLLDG